MLLLLSGPAGAAGGPCEAAVSSVTLDRVLLDAELAWGRLDLTGFDAAARQAEALLPCVGDALYPPTAARYHRIRGMRAFVERDQAEARRDFAAARALEPGWTFPESLAPPGHPVREDYTALSLDGARYEPVAPPASGRLTFDGLPTGLRARDWPTVVQVFDATGAVDVTRWLRPQDALPSYEEGPPQQVQGAPRTRSTPLLVAGGLGLLASGALGAVAAGAYDDHGLSGPTVGMGAGALGAGLAGAALLVVGGTW